MVAFENDDTLTRALLAPDGIAVLVGPSREVAFKAELIEGLRPCRTLGGLLSSKHVPLFDRPRLTRQTRLPVRPVRVVSLPWSCTVPDVARRPMIDLELILAGAITPSETTLTWAAYLMAIHTVVPRAGLALKLHSSFTGHPDVDTHAVHLGSVHWATSLR